VSPTRRSELQRRSALPPSGADGIPHQLYEGFAENFVEIPILRSALCILRSPFKCHGLGTAWHGIYMARHGTACHGQCHELAFTKPFILFTCHGVTGTAPLEPPPPSQNLTLSQTLAKRGRDDFHVVRGLCPSPGKDALHRGSTRP
jgi:hypothetical protein